MPSSEMYGRSDSLPKGPFQAGGHRMGYLGILKAPPACGHAACVGASVNHGG